MSVILLSLFVIRNCGGTCSFVEMMKRNMVRERLGTPVLVHNNAIIKWNWSG